MAPTPHHRFKTRLTGPIPHRAPRIKTKHRPIAPTRADRKALERLWRRLPRKITNDPSRGSAEDRANERLPKTIEQVARTAWVYVKFMQKAARAMQKWPGMYAGLEHQAAGGAR